MPSYTVRFSDTTSSIAAAHDISVSVLIASNPNIPTSEWDLLIPGTILTIPAAPPYPSTYTVQAGDTGNAIAAKFNITFLYLFDVNEGVNWEDLQIGQVLFIPWFPMLPGSAHQGKSLLTKPLERGTLFSVYTVRPGDTGVSIAAHFGMSFNFLALFNQGVFWDDLQVGQILQIPFDTNTSYTVKEGDTGNAIATRYGITFEALMAANAQVVNWDDLQVEQVLTVPGAPFIGIRPPPPPPPAESKKSMSGTVPAMASFNGIVTY